MDHCSKGWKGILLAKNHHLTLVWKISLDVIPINENCHYALNLKWNSFASSKYRSTYEFLHLYPWVYKQQPQKLSGLSHISCQPYLINIHLNIEPLQCFQDTIHFYLVRSSRILLLLYVMSAKTESSMPCPTKAELATGVQRVWVDDIWLKDRSYGVWHAFQWRIILQEV